MAACGKHLSGDATSGDVDSRLEEDLSQSFGDDSHEMADVSEPAPCCLAPADSFRSSSVSHCVSRLMARLLLLLFTGNSHDPKRTEDGRQWPFCCRLPTSAGVDLLENTFPQQKASRHCGWGQKGSEGRAGGEAAENWEQHTFPQNWAASVRQRSLCTPRLPLCLSRPPC